ncbi:ectoine/hydroxyectoine ABC transporter permease subunit EhuD [Bacillus alveayuensis]|jgi:polar amino acid transport system permease protein|uniref:ectoine/hydroxyectoine ABC transporter permease subunit EhuD n=1 Tax=Aeribacillus alveayuensis TaxID=279215 RepID=UPI0005CCEA7F|nr:ectoine/hydroxyectoine ABC transporter permease subunit EhuD [Bacillus alveayuensis]
MTWDWKVVAEVFPAIFKAMWVTLGLTLACYVFALLLGIVWTLLRRIPWKSFRWMLTLVLEFIRSTPPLVQLYFIFYAWPLVPYIGMTLSPFAAAIIGLGIHYSTYTSEVYRSGIDSVDKGQWEAATALNFSSLQKWTKIILPQAIPPVIPMLGNYLIIMFKEIPLTASIGVMGMMLSAKMYGAQNFVYLEPFTIVAFFFLLLSYPSAILIRKLENKMNRRFDKKEMLETIKDKQKEVVI